MYAKPFPESQNGFTKFCAQVCNQRYKKTRAAKSFSTILDASGGSTAKPMKFKLQGLNSRGAPEATFF